MIILSIRSDCCVKQHSRDNQWYCTVKVVCLHRFIWVEDRNYAGVAGPGIEKILDGVVVLCVFLICHIHLYLSVCEIAWHTPIARPQKSKTALTSRVTASCTVLSVIWSIKNVPFGR